MIDGVSEGMNELRMEEEEGLVIFSIFLYQPTSDGLMMPLVAPGLHS